MALGTPILTVTPREHDVEIVVDCTGMTLVTVWRNSAGYATPQAVRGMLGVTVSPPGNFYGVDPEVPNGSFSYFALVSDGTNNAFTPDVSVTMNHGGDYLMPLGIPDDGRLVNVESLRQQTYAVDREVVPVLGRPDPVAVSFGRHWWSGTLVLITLSEGEMHGLELMLFENRVLVFAPREGAGYPDLLYLSVGEVTMERVSAYALEEARRWSLDIQRIASPPAEYIVEPVGQTWGQVTASGKTWEERSMSDTWRSLKGL